MMYKLYFVLIVVLRYVSLLSMFILNCYLCLKRYKKMWWNIMKNYIFLKIFFLMLICIGNMSMV